VILYIPTYLLFRFLLGSSDSDFSPVKFFIREDVYLENRDPESRYPNRPSWAITKNGSCLNADMEFEYEPQPSSRSEDFLYRTRFTYEEALELAKKIKDGNVP
jgi:hypothetical protein